MSITCLCAFYRPIGCDDEAASDEEQGEKILYFYPEETPLPQRLSRITMLEALIEFTNRFSKDPLDVVIMERQTWAFLQCEPDLWIVAAIENVGASSGKDGSNMTTSPLPVSSSGAAEHRPNSTGFIDALMKMYRLYCLFCGNVSTAIRGDAQGSGLQRVAAVQEQRRRLRKLRVKMRQDERDLNASLDSARRRREGESQRAQQERSEQRDAGGEEEGQAQGTDNDDNDNDEAGEENIGSGDAEEGGQGEGEGEGEGRESSPPQQEQEHLGLRENTTTTAELERLLDETRGLVADTQQVIADLLSEAHEYTPRSVRRSLGPFLRWYLSTHELLTPSCLHSAAGIHFCPVGHPAFTSLLRVRQAADDVSRGLLLGCMLLHDGGVAWSDFDDETTFALFDFIRIKEQEDARAQLVAYLSAVERQVEVRRGSAQKDHGKDAGGVQSRSRRLTSSSMAAGTSSSSHSSSSQSQSHTQSSSNGLSEEELCRGEIEWAKRMHSRRGFVKGPHWGTVNLEDDLLQPDPDNALRSSLSEDRDRGSMQTHAWTRDDSIFVSSGGSSSSSSSSSSSRMSDGRLGLDASEPGSEAGGEAEPIMAKCSASTKGIWCPRLHACDPRVLLESPSPLAPGAATPSKAAKRKASLYRCDMGLQAGSCAVIGRAVVFRLESFLLVMLMPDWDDEQGGPPFAINHINKLFKAQEEGEREEAGSAVLPEFRSTEKKSTHEGSSSDADANDVHVDDANDNDRGSSRSLPADPTRQQRVGEGALLNLCASLERGLTPELEQLARLMRISESSSSTSAFSSSSSSHSSQSSSSSSAASNASAANTGHQFGHDRPGGPHSPTKRRTTTLPETVRLLYFNASNRALKAGSMFRGRADPILLWPQPLPLRSPGPGTGPGPWHHSPSLSSTAASARANFPLPPALLGRCLEPAVLRALNDLRETLSSRAREGAAAGPGSSSSASASANASASVTEACLRVSTQHRGGVWCVARRFGSRYVFLVIERCATLNDMYATLGLVLDEVLWQVLL